MIATKAVHLGVPSFDFGSLVEYAQDLTMISHADVVFAFLVGLAGQAGLHLSARRPRLEWAVWIALIVFCVVSVVFAVVSIKIFEYLQSPLTYRLLYLADDIKNMRSSVGAFVSVAMVAAVAGTPLVYLAVTWLTHRWAQPRRTRAFRVGQALAAAVMVAFVGYSHLVRGATWGDRNDRGILKNPHWTLLSSLVIEYFSSGTAELSESFPEEYLADFLTVGERPGGSGAAGTLQFEKPPRNVILLVLESTSTQYLDIYGGPYSVTPHLAKEATNALVFDNFYCLVGLTANAEVAINLAIYPGMTWREYTVEHPTLPGTTLADVLRPRGYRTAFIHSGDLEYTNQREFLTGRGYDDLIDYHQLDCGLPNFDYFSWGVEDRCLVDGVLKWIDRDRTRPFFALAWTIQAHHPYTLVPDEQIDFFKGNEPPGDTYSLGLYLNVLHESDQQIGRLLDGLRARGLADDTLVLITGDHGEAFGHPHDTYGHGGKLYEENMKVPLVVWNPRLFGGAGRSATVGSQVDLNPTILDCLGLAPPDSWQGHSLFDPARPPRAYFYAANNDYLFGVREGNWKYIYNASSGREQLFDLAADPTEQTSVASDHADICQRLRQHVAAWLNYEKRHLAGLHAGERAAPR
jgi:phosphoglycerol transferase MdoB-like AlkP superfamily enzyme